MKKYNLEINDLKDLSNSIYSDDNCIENERQANAILKSLTKNLENVYKFIENIEDNYDTMNKNQQKLLEDLDLYQIGDTINLLYTIKIKNIKKIQKSSLV